MRRARSAAPFFSPARAPTLIRSMRELADRYNQKLKQQLGVQVLPLVSPDKAGPSPECLQDCGGIGGARAEPADICG